MAHESIIEVSESNFDEEVKKASVPVLVDFWAEWCGPCRMLTPILDEIAREEGDAVKICKVNVDENKKLAADFGITGIPHLQFYKDGELKSSQSGVAPKAALMEKLNGLK